MVESKINQSLISLFFDNMSEFLYSENGISNITAAMIKTLPEFASVLLKLLKINIDSPIQRIDREFGVELPGESTNKEKNKIIRPDCFQSHKKPRY